MGSVGRSINRTLSAKRKRKRGKKKKEGKIRK